MAKRRYTVLEMRGWDGKTYNTALLDAKVRKGQPQQVADFDSPRLARTVARLLNDWEVRRGT